jgi:hypothetical protein
MYLTLWIPCRYEKKMDSNKVGKYIQTTKINSVFTFYQPKLSSSKSK